MGYTETQYPLNEKHAADPQIGDLWHEMFSVQYVVVGRLPRHVVVLDEVNRREDGQSFDMSKPKLMTLAEFRAAQRYAYHDGWVNDVNPGAARRVADAFNAQTEVA